MDPKSLIDSGERDHRVISAVSLGLPPTATWSEISDAMLARQAIAAQSQMSQPQAPQPIEPPTMKKASAPIKRKPVEDIDTDELHRAALARSEEGNAVAGMGGTVPRSSDYGVSLDEAMLAASGGSPDYSDSDVYGGARDDELIDAGLKERKEAAQTWVPMYVPNV